VPAGGRLLGDDDRESDSCRGEGVAKDLRSETVRSILGIDASLGVSKQMIRGEIIDVSPVAVSDLPLVVASHGLRIDKTILHKALCEANEWQVRARDGGGGELSDALRVKLALANQRLGTRRREMNRQASARDSLSGHVESLTRISARLLEKLELSLVSDASVDEAIDALRANVFLVNRHLVTAQVLFDRQSSVCEAMSVRMKTLRTVSAQLQEKLYLSLARDALSDSDVATGVHESQRFLRHQEQVVEASELVLLNAERVLARRRVGEDLLRKLQCSRCRVHADVPQDVRSRPCVDGKRRRVAHSR
jgi:hypothetical protein